MAPSQGLAPPRAEQRRERVMTPERWKQIDELFEAALDWAADERSKLLRQACAGDEELRLEVESLLSAHVQAPTALRAPGANAGARLLLSDDRDQLGDTHRGPPRRTTNR